MPLVGTEPVFVNTFKSALISAGIPATEPQFSQVWLAFTQALFAHLMANAIVTVPAGIPVLGAPAVIGTPIAGATTAPGIGTIT